MRHCLVLRRLNCLLIAATAFFSLSAKAESPVFDNPILTPTNRAIFTLTSDHRNYAIQSSANLQDWTSIASTSFGNPGSNRVHSLQAFSTNNQLFYRAVIVTSAPPFQFALTAVSNITFYGNTVIDSFDSTDPNYSTLVTNVTWGTNYMYDITKRKDHGDVVSLSTLSNSVSLQDARVYGKLHTPLSASLSAGLLGANGAIGNLAWQASNANGFQPGSWLFDADILLADVPPPPGGGLPPATGVYKGISYNYLLGASRGKYELSSALSGKLCVTGSNVVLWARGGLNFSGNADGIFIAPGANVIVYVGSASGSSVSMNLTGKGGINATGNARNCRIYGLPSCTRVYMPAYNSFNGLIYAPQADLTISNSVPAATATISGAIIAKSITTSGDVNIHHDESLANLPPDF